MTEPTIQASGKLTAASAAKAMLADRVKLVESLGDAHDQHRHDVAAVEAAKSAEQGAANAVRAAYAAAQDGGWTHAELKAAGLEAPRASRGRRVNPDRLAAVGAAPGPHSHTAD